jgi:hypothetical protein
MTVKRKKMQIDRPTTAGVLLRFFLSRIELAVGDIAYRL